MADACFELARLAALYDVLDPDRDDVDAYLAMAADQTVLTSDSTLRFRSRAEITDALHTVGFVVDDVRDAPDRPGHEFVFVTRRP